MANTRTESGSSTIYLKDYRPPLFRVESVVLTFDLHEDHARIQSRMVMARCAPDRTPLSLDGEALTLISVALDGHALDTSRYRLSDTTLTIPGVPDRFMLEIETEVRPQDNTELSGLYRSGGKFCTQCEAEGFRRITYYPDRPDVLARFTTVIEAEHARYPVLLSNGNLRSTERLAAGRHRATWEDPFPKPAYLFALVAGDLKWIEDRFVTHSGRDVALYIYTEAHNIDKCAHAMASLKNAMRWDEEKYGREYDLDRYMIVAVDDFNMGAMENKGLNVFNSQYVLANPELATDSDYQNIEGVIGHEYFHNWSGNRVTCRDWFQLSLKEGFTVFRDQQFSADMGSPGVKRVRDVNVMRTHQFREDAGPLSHPVRPQSYQEINNFYTSTVYLKGAEVVRMVHRLLGGERFRAGTDLYFHRHDGAAVTTDDFLAAMQDVGDVDLSQFRRWYDQAGTPVLDATTAFDPGRRCYTLTLRQRCAPTPGQPTKAPLHIPVAVALLGPDGRHLPLRISARASTSGAMEAVLELRGPEQTFVFEDVAEPPVPSLLRGFSAPVRLNIDLPQANWRFLLVHDDDPYVRWDAAQRLALDVLLAAVAAVQKDEEYSVPPVYIDMYRALVLRVESDPAFHAEILRLPAESYIAEFTDPIDPGAIHRARRSVSGALARAMHDELYALYEQCRDRESGDTDGMSIGRRALKNTCLGLLRCRGHREDRELVFRQFESAANMTDSLAALTLLCDEAATERDTALQAFYARWQNEPLAVNKWLSAQAMSSAPDTLTRVRELTGHPAFTLKNPNKVRALIGAFAHGNPARFHDTGGDGYRFIADRVLELDPLNPQIAARLMGAFRDWRRFDSMRRELQRNEIERVAGASLSRDTREIVAKSLASA